MPVAIEEVSKWKEMWISNRQQSTTVPQIKCYENDNAKEIISAITLDALETTNKSWNFVWMRNVYVLWCMRSLYYYTASSVCYSSISKKGEKSKSNESH